jgi:flagellar protein FliS
MTDAQAASQAHRDYTESRILSAHPVEIVHLLYQVAIDNLNAAITCLKEGDNSGRSRAVSKAQGAIDELIVALDHTVDAPFTRNLAELYDYVQREIISGHTQRSERALGNALGILTILSEGWTVVRNRVTGEDKAAGAESDGVPEKQTEAEKEINQLYAEPSPVPETARDWSC